MTSEPLHLEKDGETGDLFLVHATEKGLKLDIRFQDETLWMTQDQIAQLFGRDVSVISRHISNVLDEGELDADSNLQKMQFAHSAKPITLYDLDMVISVGYRVSSRQATLFRRWATGVLVQYAKKGFVIDQIRLKSDRDGDRIAELREIVRDIRADEANVYRELKRICSLCQDYDPKSREAFKFYQRTQAKLIHAVVSMTPSEIIVERADRNADSMGITTLAPDSIRKKDIGTSKNYLAEDEIRELNRLTTILLDIFDDQAELGRLVVMEDAAQLLDSQLKSLGRAVLRDGGSVSAADAKAHAEREYAIFDERRRKLRHENADRGIAELAKQVRDLPKTGKS